MRIGIGYRNLIDDATVTGTNWTGASPVDNVQTRELADYAQMSAATSTITIDHGTAKDMQCLALVAHTLPDTATVTLDCGTTPGGTEVYAGSATDVWPFTPLDGSYEGSHFAFILALPTVVTARYVTITIAAASGKRVGRVFLGSIFRPAVNPEYGKADDGWLPDYSFVARADNGADWVQAKTRLRSAQLAYSVLTPAEASVLHEIQRTHGTTGEVLYIPDADDLTATQQYGFLGLLRQLTALDNPFWAHRAVAIAVDERGGAP